MSYKESFIEEDELIIVLEFCESSTLVYVVGDLSQHIKQRHQSGDHFSENLILNWLLQLVMALKYIHEKKILHRDIKAANIFLTNMFSAPKTALVKEIQAGIQQASNPYEKAGWVQAWGSEIRNFESLPKYFQTDQPAAVRVQAVSSLIEACKDKKFDAYFAGELEDYEYPEEAIRESLAHLPKVNF